MLKNNKKKWILLLSIILVLVVTVSATAAYMLVPTDEKDYTMASAAVTVQPIVSRDADNLLTDVYVKNVGNAEAFVRVSIIPMYRNRNNGSLHWNDPVLGTDFDISINDAWLLYDDGYYYCKEPIAIGATTSDLINSVTVKNEPPKGFSLYFDVLVGGIQSDPDGKPVTEAWDVAVTNN